jgi:two-component system nitrate/nitrite response regulator NarL
MVASVLQNGSICRPGELVPNGPPRPAVTRVLVVDDHAFVRAGIIDILRSHDWLVVVGEAADGLQGLAKASELRPDLVVVDLNLPKLSGLGLMSALRTRQPKVKVVVLSMYEPDEVVRSIIHSGARGYLCKRDAATELVTALETVAGGGTYFDTAFSRTLLPHLTGTSGHTNRRFDISPRQREVLIGVAEGLSSKEIAARLNISIRTVETHREHLARRLHIRNVAEFTRYAIEQGYIQLEGSKP